MTATDLIVEKTNIGHAQLVQAGATTPLTAGQIRLRVDRFALTSNNLSYAAAGDTMGYWAFFPSGP